MNSTPDAWDEQMSGRERVRMVVNTLDEPATINRIAASADVAWETAADEIERLEAENRVRETDDGKYEPNPVQQLIDQVLQLISDHSRSELESQLEQYQAQLEELEAEYDVTSAQQLRARLTADDVSATEMREIRNVSDTWSALETEIRFRKHALQLYDDVSQLGGSNDDSLVTA